MEPHEYIAQPLKALIRQWGVATVLDAFALAAEQEGLELEAWNAESQTAQLNHTYARALRLLKLTIEANSG